MTEQAPDKLAIVIPTLEEADNIQTLLNRLQNALAVSNIEYELIVVDDDSRDGTADVVRHYSELDPRVRVLVRKNQRGLAGAVMHGWDHSAATLLGVIDADLQHPPEVVPQLLAALLEGNDIAIASRYVRRNSMTHWNKARQIISRLGTWVTMPLQRKATRVKDPLSGFFMVRRACLEGVDLQPEGFKILLEILVKAHIRKAVEIPFHFASRRAGKSKADAKVAWHYFSLLGKLSRHALFGPGQQ